MDLDAADPLSAPDTDIQVQMILLAAANHDIEALRALLRTGSANVQDLDSGYTPLHAAIAACESIDENPVPSTNGHANGDGQGQGSAMRNEMAAARKTVKLLFQNGAIWNDLDKSDETPGCLAARLGLKELYELVVDAGVRAELLLNRMDEYQPLGEEGDGDEEQGLESVEKSEDGLKLEEEKIEGTTVVTESSADQSKELGQPGNLAGMDVTENGPSPESYLSSTLRFSSRHLLDSSDNGVMMAWESTIMTRTAELLSPASGLRVLNIGHGMGIIDRAFQSKGPCAHHIIEAHPAVLQKMREEGWYDKTNVVVHEGRWQDVAPKLLSENQMFDVIYFDTFAEDYKALREFFSEFVIGLLDPSGGNEGNGGRFSFFHGLGADRQVVEMDLFEAGFDTEWEELKVPDLQENKEWDGIKRPYWKLENYRLPVCTFIS